MKTLVTLCLASVILICSCCKKEDNNRQIEYPDKSNSYQPVVCMIFLGDDTEKNNTLFSELGKNIQSGAYSVVPLIISPEFRNDTIMKELNSLIRRTK